MAYILTICAVGERPADFLLVAQHKVTHECLGFTEDTNFSEYSGDFWNLHSRLGTSNTLGTLDPESDPINPIYITTNATVRDQFNADQDIKRRIDYFKETDALAAESHRKQSDPRVSQEEADATTQMFIDNVDNIKARYPKV
ncbi:hypothetical protein N9937_00395 [bacterium]|nr:hypothetical protein [bacterium]